jgi:ribosomal protein L29
MTAYDLDFHAWTKEQAEALRRRSGNEIDWDNLAEEVESLGKTQVSELTSRLTVLLTHLLKWLYQPERRGSSWAATIKEQRKRIARHLRQNPSLQAIEMEEFVEAYDTARIRAAGETDLPEESFPEQAPFTLQEAKAADFWPEPDAPQTGS